MTSKKGGGLSEVREPTAEDQKLADQVKEDVVNKIGRNVSTFEVVQVATQVVAGTNYFLKVKVACDEFIHIRIYEDLQGKVELSDVKDGQTKDSPLVYF
ncbi:cystatin-A isoform X3 [Xenopus laevis]|uniref:Cystatin domain-containing protein n=2 Tax=Xenopus laevis TaxID=8355 RepID=A0A974HXK6_XENLA|nr:cystatin-A isoform X3 [Xenopus laevis]OCT93616.1 hypothetical protein XELAEV_18011291mg [Xenopus laevis]